MKPLNRLSASIFSLSEGDHTGTEPLLPSDALVIVIQERSDTIAALPLLQRHNCPRSECESLPITRRKAEKAYSGRPQCGIFVINVTG